jgi:hypothetical protein
MVWNVSGMTASPANLKLAEIDFGAAGSVAEFDTFDDDNDGDNIFLFSDPKRILYIYADRAGKISGLWAGDPGYEEQMEMNLKKGWNVMIHDKTNMLNGSHAPTTPEDGSAGGFVRRYNPPDDDYDD